ncbi:MAG: hypothetical protein ABIS03_03320 [Gemmatimonadaceae bacterium]
MQNPDNPAEQKFREHAVTGVFNDAAGFSAMERDGPGSAPPAPPYVREPLFNRKVMAAWAIAAFVVWFGVTFIVPPVVHAVRDSVMTRVEDHNARGGSKITITRHGGAIISIDVNDAKPPTAVVEPIPPTPPATAPAATAPPKR